MRQLSSLVPNADDLLGLEVEELAGVLLIHLISYGTGVGDSVVQNGLTSLVNLLVKLDKSPEYSGRQPAVNRAITEAWNWLEREGFLVRDPLQPHAWYFLSRRAQRIQSRDDFDSFRKASLFPKGKLHPLIATKVYPAFLRGEYDTAVFQAFREIEVAVRNVGEFAADSVGMELMRNAFRAVNRPERLTVVPGPLTDTSLPVAEQEAMSNVFAGAIGLYKNPQSHRNESIEAIDAAEIISFASHLLRTVDRIAADRRNPRQDT